MISQDASRARVSVVLPTYNRAALLPATLETLLAQTLCADYEVIIVDDGSADDTPAVMQPFADRGVRYERREHLGLPGAINEGLVLARGEYVMLCNDHDLYEPETLAALSEALERHSTASLAVCDVVLIDAAERPLETYAFAYDGLVAGETFAARELLPGLGSIASSNMWRASCVPGEVMDEAYGASADVAWWLRLASRGDVIHVARPLVRARERDAGSEFYYRNHHLVRDALRAKRRHRASVPAEGRRHAIERGWRRRVDRSAAASLLRALEGGRLDDRPGIAALALSEGTVVGGRAVTLLCRLPAPVASAALRGVRAAVRELERRRLG